MLRQALDPAENEITSQHSARQRQRLPETAEWLFEMEVYQAWQNDSSTTGTLWVCGPPGCGKSVLAGSIVDRLQGVAEKTKDMAVFFSYCTHANNSASQCYSLVRTFAYHLAISNPPFAEALCAVLRRHGVLGIQRSSVKGSLRDIISCEVFWTLFEQALTKCRTLLSRIVWAVDGVDEIDQDDQEILIKIIEGIRVLLPTSKMILLSRDDHHFRRKLSTLAPIELKVTEAHNKTDLQQYIVAQVQAWGALGDSTLAQEVIEVLSENANGIFLWVRLMVDELEHLHDKDQVRPSLRKVPNDMEELYDSIFQKISLRLKASEFTIFRAIMNWVSLTRKPLDLGQLASALNFYGSFSADSLRHSIPRLCGSLVILIDVNGSSRYTGIRLLHASLGDYFMTENVRCEYSVKTGQAHAELARDCLEHMKKVSQCPLFYPIGGSGPYKISISKLGKILSTWSFDGPEVIDPESPIDESGINYITRSYIKDRFPLFPYARKYVTYHMEQSAIDGEAAHLAADSFLDFIFSFTPAALIWLASFGPRIGKRKTTVEQLLGFCSKIEFSSTLSSLFIKDITLQIAGHNTRGWLFQLAKMRRGQRVLEKSEVGEIAPFDVPLDVPIIHSTPGSNVNSGNIVAHLPSSLETRSAELSSLLKPAQIESNMEIELEKLFNLVVDLIPHRRRRWLFAAICHASERVDYKQWVSEHLTKSASRFFKYEELAMVKAQMLLFAEKYEDAVQALCEVSNTETQCWDLKEITISALCMCNKPLEAAEILASYESIPQGSEGWCPSAWVEERRTQLSARGIGAKSYISICTEGVLRYNEWWGFFQKLRDGFSLIQDTESVAKCLTAALKVPRLRLRAFQEIIPLYLKNHEFEEALLEAKWAIDMFPRNHQVYELLFACWKVSPEPVRTKAYQTLQDLTKSDDPYWIAYIFCAKACICSGRYHEAIEACKASIALKGSNGIPYFFGAKAYEGLGRPSDALDFLCSAPPSKYERMQNIYNYIALLAKRLSRQEDMKNALSYIQDESSMDFEAPYGVAFVYTYTERRKFIGGSECLQSSTLCRDITWSYRRNDLSES